MPPHAATTPAPSGDHDLPPQRSHGRDSPALPCTSTGGIGGLLRAWRTTASARQGRPLTQRYLGALLGRSERWYRDLERSVPTSRLRPDQAELLADALHLGPDERYALHLHFGADSTPGTPAPDSSPHARSLLRLLVDRQAPSPACVCDRNWTITAFNQPMATWFPWVTGPGANLLRWALTHPEARLQFADWRAQAAAFVSVLKFSLARHPGDQTLLQLAADVCADPEIQRLWTSTTNLHESLDGRVYRLRLPTHGWATVHVVAHLLYPAGLHGSRLAVLTQLQADDEQPAATPVTGGAPPPDAGQDLPDETERHWTAWTPTRRTTVTSAAEAAALAGPDAIPLPALGRLIGPGSQLTLAPATRTVIWAIRRGDRQWDAAELDAHTVVVRVPAIPSEGPARQELLRLARITLPEDPAEAHRRTDALLAFFAQRMDLLETVKRSLAPGKT
jgi:hypothetical protein